MNMYVNKTCTFLNLTLEIGSLTVIYVTVQILVRGLALGNEHVGNFVFDISRQQCQRNVFPIYWLRHISVLLDIPCFQLVSWPT